VMLYFHCCCFSCCCQWASIECVKNDPKLTKMFYSAVLFGRVWKLRRLSLSSPLFIPFLYAILVVLSLITFSS